MGKATARFAIGFLILVMGLGCERRHAAEPPATDTATGRVPGAPAASASTALQVVAELPELPSAFAPGPGGRLFVALAQAPGGSALLHEVVADEPRPFPDSPRQAALGSAASLLATDSLLWVLARPAPGALRLEAFPLEKNAAPWRMDLPATLAPPGALLSLALSPDSGYAYISVAAQDAPPVLIAISLPARRYRLVMSPAFEDNSDAVGGAAALFGTDTLMAPSALRGRRAPARLGLSALSLSRAGDSLYYSPATAPHRFALPTALLHRPGEPGALEAAIRRVSTRPLGWSAATTPAGHFFVDMNAGALLRLGAEVATDARLRGPLQVHSGPDGTVYLAQTAWPEGLAPKAGGPARPAPFYIWKYAPAR